MLSKFIPALVFVTTILVTSVGAAETTNQKDCEAAGGTYSNQQGTKTCAMPFEEDTRPAGGSGNSWSAKGDKQESQKGSIGAPGTSETHEESTEVTECTNPGGNQMNTDHQHCQTQ